MEEANYRRRTGRLGGLLAGLALAELGVLQFLRGYFDIPWPELWPLFLIVPGIAVIIGALSNAWPHDRRRHEHWES